MYCHISNICKTLSSNYLKRLMLIKCLHYRTSTVLAISQPANEWILVMFQSRMREQEILQCAENGDIQSLRFMLLQDRDFSVNCTDMLGRTPLQLAVNNEHQEVSALIYSWRNRSVWRGIKKNSILWWSSQYTDLYSCLRSKQKQ